MLPFLSIWQPYNSVNLCNPVRKGATFSVGSKKGRCTRIVVPRNFTWQGIIFYTYKPLKRTPH